MPKYNGNLGKDAPQTFHYLSSPLLLLHIYLVCKGDVNNLQYIKCDVESTISFKVLSKVHSNLSCTLHITGNFALRPRMKEGRWFYLNL